MKPNKPYLLLWVIPFLFLFLGSIEACYAQKQKSKPKEKVAIKKRKESNPYYNPRGVKQKRSKKEKQKVGRGPTEAKKRAYNQSRINKNSPLMIDNGGSGYGGKEAYLRKNANRRIQPGRQSKDLQNVGQKNISIYSEGGRKVSSINQSLNTIHSYKNTSTQQLPTVKALKGAPQNTNLQGVGMKKQRFPAYQFLSSQGLYKSKKSPPYTNLQGVGMKKQRFPAYQFLSSQGLYKSKKSPPYTNLQGVGMKKHYFLGFQYLGNQGLYKVKPKKKSITTNVGLYKSVRRQHNTNLNTRLYEVPNSYVTIYLATRMYKVKRKKPKPLSQTVGIRKYDQQFIGIFIDVPMTIRARTPKQKQSFYKKRNQELQNQFIKVPKYYSHLFKKDKPRYGSKEKDKPRYDPKEKDIWYD